MNRSNYYKTIILFTVLLVPILRTFGTEIGSLQSVPDKLVTSLGKNEIEESVYLLSTGNILPGNNSFEETNQINIIVEYAKTLKLKYQILFFSYIPNNGRDTYYLQNNTLVPASGIKILNVERFLVNRALLI